MFTTSTAPTSPPLRTIFGRAQYPVLCFSWRGVEKIFVFRSFLAAFLASFLFFLVVGLSVTGGYLFLRDDLVKATLANQARMQHAYEDRLAAMRTQVDLVTSRQMLDQQAVEHRVAKLMARQDQLGARSEQAGKVLSRALRTNSTKPFKGFGSKKPFVKKKQGLRLGSLSGSGTDQTITGSTVQVANVSSKLFDNVEQSLHETERAQIEEINRLKKVADKKASKLARILTKQGIVVPGKSGIGGPMISLKGSSKFTDSVDALDASLNVLESVRKAAKSLPHGSPVAGQKISSRFGTRRDPFTGKRAVHGGLDFKAKRGHVVRATASGKVVKAGRLGGYGKLVEIDHGGGITTRYGHLSRIKVRVGQRISRGTKIGNVGSTGRSTGPHLHYEVRRKGRVLNPIHYVRLEKHLKPYL